MPKSADYYDKKMLKYKMKYFNLKNEMIGSGMYDTLKKNAPSKEQIYAAAKKGSEYASQIASHPATRAAFSAALAEPSVQKKIQEKKEQITRDSRFQTVASHPLTQMAKENISQTKTAQSIASHPLTQTIRTSIQPTQQVPKQVPQPIPQQVSTPSKFKLKHRQPKVGGELNTIDPATTHPASI
jgi:hypothetical protein